jgi:hypothetical protein
MAVMPPNQEDKTVGARQLKNDRTQRKGRALREGVTVVKEED